MGVVQQVGFDQGLEVIGMHCFPQFLQHLFILQAADGIDVIDPAVHNGKAVDQSLGVGAEVRFPQLELRAVQGRFQQLLVDAFHGNFLQVMIQGLHEGVLLLGFAAAGPDGENVLQHAAAHASGNIFGHARIQQGTAQGRPFRFQQHVFQKAQGHDSLLVTHVPRHDLHFMEGHGLHRRSFRHRVGPVEFRGFRQRLLQGDLRTDPPRLAEIFQVAVQKSQGLFNIHIAVQINVGIFRAVKRFMESKEILLGQAGNGRRQPAGFKPVGGIREQQLLPVILQPGIRGRIHALHLVVDHPVVLQGGVSVFQFVVPPFLLKGKGIVVDQRIKHRVQVHVHQIAEILVVSAGHRVHCLIRVGHSVKERVQGPFHQFHKRLLQMVLP